MLFRSSTRPAIPSLCLLLRRRESGGIPFLCLRRVISRAWFPGGAGGVVLAASRWNNGVGFLLPPRLRLLGWSCGVAGGWCSRICRSVKLLCSGAGHCDGGGGRGLELLSPVPFSVSAELLLAPRWGFWGFGGAALVEPPCLYRRLWRCFKEEDGGPGVGRRLVGVGSACRLRGRQDPERDDLGARRRPMQLLCPHPTRRSWCNLRLTNAFWLGVHPVLRFGDRKSTRLNSSHPV